MTMSTATARSLFYMLATIFALITQAHAQTGVDRPFYVGVNIGIGSGDVDGYSSTDVAGIGTLKSLEDSLGDSAEGSWRLYAGYRINDYLDTEISYATLGTFERKASRPSGTYTFVPIIGSVPNYRCIDEEFETSLLGLSLLLHPGFNTAFYGKLSANFWEADTATHSGVIPGSLFAGFGVASCDEAPRNTDTKSGTDLGVGAGMRFDMGDWAVRGEIERIGGIEFSRTGEAAIYTISISAEYRF